MSDKHLYEVKVDDLLNADAPIRVRLQRVEAIVRAATIVGGLDGVVPFSPEDQIDRDFGERSLVLMLLLEAARISFRDTGSAQSKKKSELAFMRSAAEASMWMSGNYDARFESRGLFCRRRNARFAPKIRRSALRLSTGETQIVSIRDVSASGVSLETAWRPPISERVHIGRTVAIVVRHFESGIAAQFLRPFPCDTPGQDILL